MANAKKKVGIVILVIGLLFFVGGGYNLVGYGSLSTARYFIIPTIVGVVIIVIGLVVLLASRKKNSKSPDKSIT